MSSLKIRREFFQFEHFIDFLRTGSGLHVMKTKSNVVAEMHRGKYWLKWGEEFPGFFSATTQVNLRKPEVYISTLIGWKLRTLYVYVKIRNIHFFRIKLTHKIVARVFHHP